MVQLCEQRPAGRPGTDAALLNPGFAGAACRGADDPEVHMLQTLVIILVLLWLLGMVSSYTLGGLLHILLVIALILVIVRLVSGRSVV